MNQQFSDQVSQKRHFQVSDEYDKDRQFSPDPSSFPDMATWAQTKDQMDVEAGGAPTRQAGYNGTNWFKQLMGAEERLADPVSNLTGKLGGAIGGLADSAIGTEGRLRSVGQEVGYSLPIDIGEQAAFALSGLVTGGAGWGGNVAKGAVAAGKYGNLARKALGIGAMANTAGRTYAQTDSPTQGLIAAAGLPVGDKLAGLGADLVSKYAAKKFGGSTAFGAIEGMAKSAEHAGELQAANLMKGTLPTVAGASLGAVAGSTAANELQRQASVTADELATGEFTPEAHNPFTVENIGANVFGGVLGADLPRVFKATTGSLRLNPVLAEKYGKWVNDRRAKREELSRLSSHDLMSRLSDPNLTPEARDQLARDFAAGPDALRDQSLIKYNKEVPVSDDRDFADRIDAFKKIKDKLWLEFDRREVDSGDDFFERDDPSNKMYGAAIKQLGEQGYLDLSDAAMAKRLERAEKYSLGESTWRDQQTKVVQEIANQLEVEASVALERRRADWAKRSSEEFAVTPVSEGMSVKDQKDRARQEWTTQAQESHAATQFSKLFEAMQEMEKLGEKQPMVEVPMLTPNFENTVQGQTTSKQKVPLSQALKEAVIQISAYEPEHSTGDVKYRPGEAKARMAQFAADMAEWWNQQKGAVMEGKMDPNMPVNLPEYSVWSHVGKESKKTGTIQVSLNDMLKTVKKWAGKTEESDIILPEYRKWENTGWDPQNKKSIETDNRGENLDHEWLLDRGYKLEDYNPGDSTTGYEAVRQEYMNRELEKISQREEEAGADIERRKAQGELTEEQANELYSISAEEAMSQKAGVRETLRQMNDLEKAALDNLNQYTRENAPAIWSKFAKVFLTREEGPNGPTLKPSQRTYDAKIGTLHMVIPAMLEYGMLPEKTAWLNRTVPEKMRKVMDVLKPGWEKSESPVAVISGTLNNYFTSAGGYNNAFRQIAAIHAGLDNEVVPIRESKKQGSKTSAAKPSTKVTNLLDGLFNRLMVSRFQGGMAVTEDSSMPQVNRAYYTMHQFAKKLGMSDDVAHTYATLGAKTLTSMSDDLGKIQVFKYARGNEAWDILSPTNKLEIMTKGLSEVDALGLNVATKDGTMVGVADPRESGSLSSMDKLFVLQRGLDTLTHELVHHIERQATGQIPMDFNNPKTMERVRAYKGAWASANALDPKTKALLLSHVGSFMAPHDSPRVENDILGSAMYGSQNNSEFLAVFGGMIGQGVMTDKKYKVSPGYLYSFMPLELAMYSKGVARDLKENLEVMRPMLARNLKDVKVMGHFDSIVENLHKIIEGEKVRVADKAFSETMAALQAGTTGAMVPRMGVWEDVAPDLTDPMSPVKTFAPGGKPYSWIPELHNNWVFKYFNPMIQTMDKMRKQGLTLANDAMTSLLDYVPNRNNMLTRFWEPFLDKTHMVGAGTSAKLNENNPMVKITRDPKGRKAINDLLTDQQNNKAAFVVQGLAGKWQVDPSQQTRFNNFTAGLSATEKDTVIEVLGAYKTMAKTMLGQMLEGKKAREVHKMTQDVLHQMQDSVGTLAPMGHKEVRQLMTELYDSLYAGNLTAANNIVIKLAPWANVGQRQADRLNKLLPVFKQTRRDLLAKSDWWAPQQRPGRYLVVSTDPSNMVYVDGAETSGVARKMQSDLESKGHNVKIVDKYSRTQRIDGKSVESVRDKTIELADEGFFAWLNTNPMGFTTQEIDAIKATYLPGEYVRDESTKTGLNKFLRNRKSVPAAYGHDYVENFVHHTSALAETLSRRELTDSVATLLSDVQAANQEEFRNLLRTHVDTVLSPNPEGYRTIKALTSAYYLACNLSSLAIEFCQSALTMVPQLIKNDPSGKASILDAYKTYGKALWTVIKLSDPRKRGYYDKIEKDAANKVATAKMFKLPVSLTPEEELVYHYRQAHHRGELTHSAINDDSFAGDQQAVLNNAFAKQDPQFSDPWALARDKTYWGATWLLKWYSTASNFNNKVAMVAGLLQGQKGKKTDADLYQHAINLKTLSMFGGGKVNLPGYQSWASDQTRPALAAYHTLQQYTMAMLGHYAQTIGEALPEKIGTKHVPPGARLAARKALGTMLVTQASMAGALGLPMVGAGMTMLENLTGVDSEQAMREWLSSIGKMTPFGEDFSDLAMSGMFNKFLGLDVGSRMGTGGFAGTSYYNGWSIKDLAGPIPNVAENVYKGIGYARSGDVLKGIHQMLPNGLKGAAERGITYYRYGDDLVRDPSARAIHDPSTTQNVGMAIGFRPFEVSQKSNMAKQLVQSREQAKTQNDAELDDLARKYLQGDQGPARQLAGQRMKASGSMEAYHSTLRAIAGRATEMKLMRDYTKGQTIQSAPGDSAIFSTYRPEVSRGSSNFDQAMTDLRNQMSLGSKPQRPVDALKAAVMMDSLMGRGMSRAQAQQVLGLVQ